MIWQELNEALVLPGIDAPSSDEVMRKVGGAFIRDGYAKDSYVDALIAREKDFPTGLDIDGVGVAIPHTDVSHVIRQGVAIATLREPATFVQMGTDDETVGVSLVFMLCVIEPNEHLEQLKKIIAIIQDKKVLTAILGCKDPQSIIEIIKNKEESL